MGLMDFLRGPSSKDREFKAPTTGRMPEAPRPQEREPGIPIVGGKIIYYTHPNSGENYLAVEGYEDRQVITVGVNKNGEYKEIYPYPGTDLDTYLYDSTHGPTTFDGQLHLKGPNLNSYSVEVNAVHHLEEQTA